MFDTTGDPKATFEGLKVEAVAAYGNGKPTNYPEAKAQFPHVPVVEIDVLNAGIGDAGDFEKGDMLYTEAGEWASRRIKAGVHRPIVYFQVSESAAIHQSLEAAGVKPQQVRMWTAHYTGKPHLCSSECGFGHDANQHADATQWGSPGYLPPPFKGRNIDVSETKPDFF
ncbi:MAG TPA: hypothetical protein VF587_01460 [Solirubrobacteraceae bacterium]|jgi:3-oxoacyl-(acyl-carrier-protein) synthase